MIVLPKGSVDTRNFMPKVSLWTFILLKKVSLMYFNHYSSYYTNIPKNCAGHNDPFCSIRHLKGCLFSICLFRLFLFTCERLGSQYTLRLTVSLSLSVHLSLWFTAYQEAAAVTGLSSETVRAQGKLAMDVSFSFL